MKTIRIVLLALMLATPLIATAASYSTDQSDLWWANPPGSENGWGIQFVQRGDTIFATVFVYGPAGAPTWYVATMVPTPPGSLVWSGDLYTTTGSWFGAVPYNPAVFTATKVGTMTWDGATLTYSVNGVRVSKPLTRQTLVIEDYSGHYGGVFHETVTGCANPAFNSTLENAAILDFVQNGTTVTLVTLPVKGASCTYSGTLTQYGQMGVIAGNVSCADGTAGSFQVTELQVTEFSVTGRFTASASVPAGCQTTGWFAGIIVTTF